MGVNRDVPMARERLHGSGVVEMGVVHDNRGGAGIPPETMFGCFDDGVDQHPIIGLHRITQKNDVDDRQAQMGKIPSDDDSSRSSFGSGGKIGLFERELKGHANLLERNELGPLWEVPCCPISYRLKK